MHYLFFLIPFLLVVGAQAYVSHHVWTLLPFPLGIRVAAVVAMAVCLMLFFVPFFRLGDTLPLALERWCYQLGSSWLVVLLYAFLLCVVADLMCRVGWMPRSWLTHNLCATLVVLGSFGLLLTLAYLRYDHKVRVPFTFSAREPLAKPMRLVFVSDLHLGFHNTRYDLHRWLALFKEEQPDAILIAGDLIDGNYRPVQEQRMWEEFRELGIPVLACLGNHDYLAGIDNTVDFCQKAGIQLLRDSAATLCQLAVVGRDDRMNPHRKNLRLLTRDLNSEHRFSILLDHQPYHLEQAEQCGIDLELAGHTHHGQIWPLNLITDAVYEKSYGRHERGATSYYISSGLGIWGPKFRIGTQSEYVVIEVR